MPSRIRHSKFDDILRNKGIIHQETDGTAVHRRLDTGAGKYGSLHRQLDRFHSREGVEQFIRTIVCSLGAIGRKLATDYVRVGCGHLCLDKIASQRRRQNRDWSRILDRTYKCFIRKGFQNAVYRHSFPPMARHIPSRPGYPGSGVSMPMCSPRGWVNLFYTELKHSDTTEIHRHTDAEEYHYIDRGSVLFYIEDSVFLLKENGVVYVPKRSRHAIRSLTDSRIITVGVQPDRANGQISTSARWESELKQVRRLQAMLMRNPEFDRGVDNIVAFLDHPILEVRWMAQSMISNCWHVQRIVHITEARLRELLLSGRAEGIGSALGLMNRLLDDGKQLSRGLITEGIEGIKFPVSIVQWYAYNLAITTQHVAQNDLDCLANALGQTRLKTQLRFQAYCMLALLNLIMTGNQKAYRRLMSLAFDVRGIKKPSPKPTETTPDLETVEVALVCPYLFRLSGVSSRRKKQALQILATVSGKGRSIPLKAIAEGAMDFPNCVLTQLENVRRIVNESRYCQILEQVVLVLRQSLPRNGRRSHDN